MLVKGSVKDQKYVCNRGKVKVVTEIGMRRKWNWQVIGNGTS